MSEKIRISWDDVKRPEVDRELKRQDALNLSQPRHSPAMPEAQVPSGTVRGSRSLWRNSIIYTVAFGLVGALAAWAMGEFVWSFEPKDLSQILQLENRIIAVDQEARLGRITQFEADNRNRAIEDQFKADPRNQSNRYAKVIFDKTLTERERDDR